MDGVVANSGSFEAWVGFAVFLVAALAVDLGIVTRGSHEVRARRAVVLSIAWIAVALVFAAGLFIWHDDGPQKSLEFLTAYLVEESLSIDNLFVFLVTFTYFQVRTRYQHRVLFWGILGAVVMRGLFIGVGGALLHAFHWVVREI